MLDVCLLGTAGMMPLPYRWLTSMMLRFNGSSLLVDCGEGTQIAIKEAGLSFNPIDVLCVTHFHADHISGLPGLLLTMGNADRTEPLTIIGPKGLERVVNAMRTIAPELPFEIKCVEMTEADEYFEINGYHIHGYKVKHNVPCYGYSFEIKRAGKFDVERAKANNIPMKLWNPLQKGATVEHEGVTYTPDMVLGPARKGIKVAYCTDSRPTDAIVGAAEGADLFICEGMYAEKEKLAKARQYKHMTFYEAAEMAKRAQVEELWLTHFSPSLIRAEDYMPEVRKIFANAHLGKDGKTKYVFIALACIAFICTGFYFATKDNATDEKVLTEIEKVIAKDIEKEYPQTPRAVVSLYNRIVKCYYGDQLLTEDQLNGLVDQMQLIMDEELLAVNPREEYYKTVVLDIASYKQNKKYLVSTKVEDTNDIDKITDDTNGKNDKLAYVDATYYLNTDGNFAYTYQRFVLRQDDVGRWKILTFYKIKGDESDGN